jgi:type II secretory pathway pseudopilin PulG
MPPPPTGGPPKNRMNGCLIALLIGIGVFFCIAIAGVIAALVIPAVTSVKAKARQTEQVRALTIATVNSINAYHAEYGRYPLPQGPPSVEAKPVRTDGKLTAPLLGSDEKLNPKALVFLRDLDTVHSRGGNGLKLVGDELWIVDAWDEALYVLVDSDGNGEIRNPDPRPGRPTVLLEKVVVYSAGPDKDPATWADNVMTVESSTRSPASPSTPPPLPELPPVTPEPPRDQRR